MSVRQADVCLKSNHNSKAKGSIISINIIKAQKYLIIINFISNIINYFHNTSIVIDIGNINIGSSRSL